MKAEYIAKIRETAEYIIENPCEYDRDTSEYENAESDFFWHGACEIFVGFDDILIRLVPDTMKEDAKFVLNNLEKITYFYIVNEDYDSVVGDICAYFRKFNFNRDYVASYEYTQAVIDLMGKFTIDDLDKYFNNKYRPYIFDALYNELNAIKNAIADNENYSFTKLYEADGLEYLVILNDHRVFYISVGTNVLPEFDKNNVLYIRKKIGRTEFIDTEVGYFQTDDQLSHGYDMEEKFGVTEDFNTHCYDNLALKSEKQVNMNHVFDGLKSDLNFAKNIIKDNGVYDVEYLDFNSERRNGFQFHVILKNGSFFHIVLGSTIFPNIEFDDIVYIKKVRCFDYSEQENKYQCCDTLIGDFNCDDIEKYEKTVYEKFNLKYDDEIETGGYD